MSVGRRRLLQHYWYKVSVLHIHSVPFHERVVTVIYLVQIEPKNGFETDKTKDGYRLCGYLPQPRTSRHLIHIWMSYLADRHVSHVAHMIESCHTCKRVMFTYEWDMSHIHEWVILQIDMRVMSHIWMSHVTRMNESCHTYGCVMSHIWMRHVSFIYEWVVFANRHASHVAHMNESCHTYEWVMSHIWMSHVTRMIELCHTYEWVM